MSERVKLARLAKYFLRHNFPKLVFAGLFNRGGTAGSVVSHRYCERLWVLVEITALIMCYCSRTFPWLDKLIRDYQCSQVVYFAKSDGLRGMNKAVQYVRANEQTEALTVVHVNELSGAEREAVIARFQSRVELLNEQWVFFFAVLYY